MNFKERFLKPFLFKFKRAKKERVFSFKGHSKEIGHEIEQWVGEFLTKKSFEILEYNYSVPQGEIDLIAKESNEVVFIEVKAIHERTLTYLPEEKVSSEKINRLVKAGESWLQAHPNCDECRFDVIAIIYNPTEGVKDLKHFRNAIEL